MEDRFGVTKGGNCMNTGTTIKQDLKTLLKGMRQFKCIHGRLWRNRKCRICMEPIR